MRFEEGLLRKPFGPTILSYPYPINSKWVWLNRGRHTRPQLVADHGPSLENPNSLYDYLALVNQPAIIALLYHLQFNIPTLIMTGTFTTGGTNTVDLGKVDTEYIGAHFIPLFYNLNFKINFQYVTRAAAKSSQADSRECLQLGSTFAHEQRPQYVDRCAVGTTFAALA